MGEAKGATQQDYEGSCEKGSSVVFVMPLPLVQWAGSFVRGISSPYAVCLRERHSSSTSQPLAGQANPSFFLENVLL